MKGKLNKLVSIILVLVLVLANFAPIAKALDTNLENQGIETSSDTVKFDTYFKNEKGEKVHTKQGKLDEEDTLYVYLKVEEGYIKNGEITLDTPNFKLKQEKNDVISQIDGNKILLNTIRNGDEVELAIKIEKIDAEEIPVDYFGKETEVKFTASQVKNNGRTLEVSKKLTICKKWQGEGVLQIEQGIIKYIVEEDGIIMQQKVKVNLENNSLPIEKEKIEIEIPSINGTAPKNIYVNGTANEFTEEEIDETNWKKQENKIQIEVANPVKENKITWRKGVKDEYYITYIYGKENVQEAQKGITVKLSTKAQVVAYNIERTTYEEQSEKQGMLKENVNNIVMIDLVVDNEIQKGNMYYNIEKPKYQENYELDIAKPDVESIKITSQKATYQTEEEVDATYTKTEVSKKHFDKIIGKEGSISILNEEGEEVASINNSSKEENGNYIAEYEAKQITIVINKTKAVGKISIKNTKEIEVAKTEEKIKQLETIKSKIVATVNDKIKFEKEQESNLKEPEIKIETSINKNTFSTVLTNENIEIKTVLKAEDETCKLLENPKIEIQLPEAVENINFTQGKLLFTDELKIKRAVYTKEAKLIEIETEGKITKLNDVSVAKGATILIVCDIDLKEDLTLKEDEITVTVKEEQETQNKLKINYITPITDEVANTQEEPNTQDKTASDEVTSSQQAPNQSAEIPAETAVEAENPNTEPITVETPKTETPLKAALQNITLKLESDVEGKEVLEGSTITYKATVINLGEKTLKNAVLTMPVPEGTVLREYVVGDSYTGDKIIEKEDSEQSLEIENLEPNKAYTLEMEVLVKEKGTNTSITNNAILNVENYDTLTSETLTNNIKDGGLTIDLLTGRIKTAPYKSGEEVEIHAKIKNISTSKTINEVKAELVLPNELEYISSEYFSLEDKALGVINYNETNKTLSYEINQIAPLQEKVIIIICKVKEGITEFKAQMKANYQGVTDYTYSNEITRYVENPKLEVKYYTDVTKEYVDVGDKLNYYIEIKNVGLASANNVEIEYQMPEGIENTSLSYRNKTIAKDNITIKNESQKFSSYTVDAGDTLLLTISGTVSSLPEGAKGTIKLTSKAYVTANDIEKIETEEIIHKIKVITQEKEEENKKLTIEGIAWEDASRDGIKDEGEKLLRNIKVTLITKEDAIKVKETKTNKFGEYKFQDIEPGEYIIVFEYDTAKYETTKYQVEGTSEDKISSAALSQVTLLQDGTALEGAITNVIKVETSNLYNINFGIMEKATFDLSLEKKISKITVQNSNGTKTYDYTANPKELAKIEIASKDVKGTNVIIEYEITIKNKGNIEGYVNKIVDYIPKDLKFNSELNKNWYISTDGNIYTEELKGTVINPGEEKKIKIILTKTLTENNLGNTNNQAEIAESMNNYGIKDINSEAGNKNTKENDYSSADIIISLNTGTIIMYVTLSISMIMLIGIGAYMIKKHVLGNN